MTRPERRAGAGLYRLLAWLSPGFPTGAFSYSHGLEAAAAAGAVYDRANLEAWVAAIVRSGGGRIDADILRAAYRAAAAGDLDALTRANARGVAYRPTAELALEAAQQGAAFLAACRAAWPDAVLAGWRPEDGACHSAVFGAAAARAAIGLGDALTGYLQAFAANLIAVGLRLGLVGQTDGQRILASLEPVIAGAAAAALRREGSDFGAATFAADLMSIAHETQYSRLFRS
ncbi:MAG TPA: urease accessory UreF family protein [Stellaceae bacterium]|nr:urease accessory UreF family protein [Stellaceae bacterium]